MSDDKNIVAIFWMIWNPSGRAPTQKHSSIKSAEEEARRLARVAPGEQFIILRSVGGFRIESPEPKPIMIDDGLPF